MRNTNATDATLSATVALCKAIGQGAQTISSLRQHLKRNKSNISRIANKAIKRGLIAKIGYPYVYELTGAGRLFVHRQKGKSIHKVASLSWGVRGATPLKTARLHSTALKFPILSDNPAFLWDKVNKNFKNHLIKYKFLNAPVKITIEKTTKSIILHLEEKETERKLFMTEFMNLCFKSTYYAYFYLKQKGITFDMLGGEVIQQHIANIEPDYEEATDKKITVKQELGRAAAGAFKSSLPSQAWIDRSLGALELETNDMIYEEKLIMMPESIEEIRQQITLLKEYNHNIRLHLEVLTEMKDTLKGIREALNGKV